MAYEQRIAALDARLRGLAGAVVAFSGGVDSSALLHACVRVLGERVLAVTADSPSLPRAELDDARALAAEIGAVHRVLATDELSRPDYRKNAADRCYHCKTELFDVVELALATEEARAWPVVFGAIADDAGDHRPGARAARERGVGAPLAEACMTKDDVRRYCREQGLAVADKPASACLASRVPYGTSIDAEMLARIERAEAALHALGYAQCRVRHHGDVARVELPAEDLSRAITRDRDEIIAGVRAAGYLFVALDMAGYRTGSLNQVLS